MTENELKHHFFGHPDHQTFVIPVKGAIQSFINFYPLIIVREEQRAVYIIVEFLITESDNQAHAALLLNQAVSFAESIKAKGIVLENATYLNYDAYRQLGLTPSLRRMTMSVIAKNNDFDYVGNFRCDVK
jgi:hypothetical protein